MKYLVVLFSVVSVCLASPVSKPIDADYLIPQAAPIVIPAPAPIARVLPFAPSPVRFLANPAPFPLARAQFAPAPLTAAPFPVARAQFAPAPLTAAPFPVARAQFAPAPLPFAAPLAAAPAPLPVPTPLAAAPIPVALPVPVVDTAPSFQFHAQDEFGGFSFGYANGQSSKQESRTPDGVTRGGYSYVDANGITQQVEYISDPINGFRVAGTNIPVVPDVQTVAISAPVMDTAEVAAAKAEFALAFDAAVARNAALETEAVVLRRKRSYSNDYLVPAAQPITVLPPQETVTIPAAPFVEPPTFVQRANFFNPNPQFFAPAPAFARVAAPTPFNPQFFAPAPVAALPRVVATPAAAPIVAALPVPAPILAPAPVVNTQFQAQDEFGGYSFGYQNGLSGHQESRTPDGVTRGSYSYVDANNIVQHVQYTADAINGFQVIGTNLPVAPVA